MSCGNRLKHTGHHTFQRHASPPRAAAAGIVSPMGGLFAQIVRPISPSGPLGKPLIWYMTRSAISGFLGGITGRCPKNTSFLNNDRSVDVQLIPS